MQQQKTELQYEQCPRCHKLIDQARFPIHIYMCSTIKLRQTCIQQSKHQNKPQNYTQCIFCTDQIPISLIEKHMSSCNQRFIGCRNCKQMHPYQLIEKHYELCGGANQQEENSLKYPDLSAYQYDSIQPATQAQVNEPQINMNNLINSINQIGLKLKDASNKLAKYISQQRGSATEKWNKIKEEFNQSLQVFFLRVARGPGVEGLSKNQVRNIESSVYKAKNNNQPQQLCTICYCQFQNEQPIKILQCKHIYHPECIDKWMRINKKCPICNHEQFQNKKS